MFFAEVHNFFHYFPKVIFQDFLKFHISDTWLLNINIEQRKKDIIPHPILIATFLLPSQHLPTQS